MKKETFKFLQTTLLLAVHTQDVIIVLFIASDR